MRQYESLAAEAASVAVRAHDGQYRTGTKFPYVVHPLNVGHILRDYYDNEILEAAGYLHDVIEDSAWTREVLEERFGYTIAYLVDAVTRKPNYNLNGYVADKDVMRLKCADVLDNVTDTIRGLGKGHDVWSRFAPGKKKAKYWRSIVRTAEHAIGTEPLWKKTNEITAVAGIMAMELGDER